MDQAADMLAEKWKTNRFPVPKDMEAPFMKLVRLPNMKEYPSTDPTMKVSMLFIIQFCQSITL